MLTLTLHFLLLRKTNLVQVLFQSSKPIPVMVLGIILLGKRYNVLQYIATAFLLAGLILFSGADAATSTTFSLFGKLIPHQSGNSHWELTVSCLPCRSTLWNHK